MKKLVIAKKYQNLFENWNNTNIDFIGKISLFEGDFEITYSSYMLCDTSKFRKILHTIIDLDSNCSNKNMLHDKISNKDFTSLIFSGILEVKDVK